MVPTSLLPWNEMLSAVLQAAGPTPVSWESALELFSWAGKSSFYRLDDLGAGPRRNSPGLCVFLLLWIPGCYSQRWLRPRGGGGEPQGAYALCALPPGGRGAGQGRDALHSELSIVKPLCQRLSSGDRETVRQSRSEAHPSPASPDRQFPEVNKTCLHPPLLPPPTPKLLSRAPYSH